MKTKFDFPHKVFSYLILISSFTVRKSMTNIKLNRLVSRKGVDSLDKTPSPDLKLLFQQLDTKFYLKPTTMISKTFHRCF